MSTGEQALVVREVGCAHAEMLAALEVTLGNIISLGAAGALENVPMPYRVWADVVKAAIDKAKAA